MSTKSDDTSAARTAPNAGTPQLTELASLVAHQLKTPVTAAASLVQGLLGEYAGPLTPRQRDLLARANTRIEEALTTSDRMMAIARPESARTEPGVTTDLSLMVRQSQNRYSAEAARRGIAFAVETHLEPAPVRGTEAALFECLNCLVDNALKYTPDNGRIRITVAPAAQAGQVRVAVADSGIGIPENNRDTIFEPFVRADSAQESALPGVGLGLAFVKRVATALNGDVAVQQSDLGGAELTLVLPLAEEALPQSHGGPRPRKRMKVVIIGGVAAGPKVAAKVIRLKPDTEVTVIDRGAVLSYAGCGFPYYVSGVVKKQRDLISSAVGAVRDPVFFQNVKHVNILNRTEATEIDRHAKQVRVRNLLNHEESWVKYDKLVLATGASPVIPDIPGTDLQNVFTLHGVHDAEGIRAVLSSGKARDVVIVGGGLLGVEITQALVNRGCRVTILEKRDQILTMLDWQMARLVEKHMESHGVKIVTGTSVSELAGIERVEGVISDRGRFPAEMVVLAVGVKPEIKLAADANLDIGTTGALKVNDHLQTSDPDIYAAGDCVEQHHILTGKPFYMPLGSTANKQGRTAAVNLCGGEEDFPGVIGSIVCTVFGYCVGCTGLGEEVAEKAGYHTVSALVPAPDREHFLPGAKQLLLKIVVDHKTRRLLGCQAIGEGNAAKRIDVAATAVTAGMTVDQLANLDLCYAPACAPAMDNIITAANVARNKLSGAMQGISAADVRTKIEREDDFVFLDVRTHDEYEEERLPNTKLIPLGALRGRLSELPKDKDIVTFCSVSVRAYEAALILKHAGFKTVRVMDGGIQMWPFEKIEGVL